MRETDTYRLVNIQAEERFHEIIEAIQRKTTHMLDTVFQDMGFNETVSLLLLIRQGPCSWNSPIILELPGFRIAGISDKQDDGPERHTYSAIEPDGQGCSFWIVTSGKEPEPAKSISVSNKSLLI